MPLTFSQVWPGFKNIALKAFDPIMLKLSEIANSEKFQAVSYTHLMPMLPKLRDPQEQK